MKIMLYFNPFSDVMKLHDPYNISINCTTTVDDPTHSLNCLELMCSTCTNTSLESPGTSFLIQYLWHLMPTCAVFWTWLSSRTENGHTTMAFQSITNSTGTNHSMLFPAPVRRTTTVSAFSLRTFCSASN